MAWTEVHWGACQQKRRSEGACLLRLRAAAAGIGLKRDARVPAEISSVWIGPYLSVGLKVIAGPNFGFSGYSGTVALNLN